MTHITSNVRRQICIESVIGYENETGGRAKLFKEES